jgi:hypothetical protein
MFDFDLLFEGKEDDLKPVWTWYQPEDADRVPFSKEVRNGNEQSHDGNGH